MQSAVQLIQATPTDGFQNASASVMDGFSSTTSLTGPLLVVLYAVLAIAVGLRIAPWLAEYRILSRVGGRLSASVAYFTKGLGTALVLAALALPVYALWTVDGSTRAGVGKVVGALVLGYVTLVALGWAGEHVVARFIDAHPEHESWDDIWPDVEAADDLDDADLAD